MTNFEHITTMNQSELAKWLDLYGDFDTSPWMTWFDKNYCQKCEPIKCHAPAFGNQEIKCSFCELEDYCKFFNKDMNNVQILELWLNQTVDET